MPPNACPSGSWVWLDDAQAMESMEHYYDVERRGDATVEVPPPSISRAADAESHQYAGHDEHDKCHIQRDTSAAIRVELSRPTQLLREMDGDECYGDEIPVHVERDKAATSFRVL